MLKELKRAVLGLPIASKDADHQKLSKRRALAVFSSDALSSVAYATDEILTVLVAAGGLALSYSVGISFAIVSLLLLVVLSYRQTLHEYPNGGGAYIVAKENLGSGAGLLAAAALLVDYVLTVAVSVSAGVAALTSALPELLDHRVGICLVIIVLITLANLRGMKESSTVFSIPTYIFIFSIFLLISVGFYKVAQNGFVPLPVPEQTGTHPLTIFLILKAFSSGCTAMTGVEAVSNGVPAFRHPQSRNAAITLIVMSLILGSMFLGTTLLAYFFGIAPLEHETVLSQIARAIFGTSWVYYGVQGATMLILVLAANTAYADFPRLSSLLAQDRFLPRQLSNLGDRLVFSNGIFILGFFSGALILLFHADTHSLIPLYAVGVFLSFTLSQAGMIRHWWRDRTEGWIHGLAVNSLGVLATFIVFCIFILTKFIEGAWAVVLILPLLIGMFLKIHRHYLDVGRQLVLTTEKPEDYRAPLRHTVILPISGVHRGVMEALRYAESIGKDVRAVYVEIDPTATERIRNEWTRWGRGVPLVVLKSPYRSIVTPLLKYIDEVEDSVQDDIMTIIVPEFVAAKWWQTALHNQSAIFLRASLLFRRGKVVTSVRYHLS